MKALYLSILLCVGLIGVCLLPAEADNGYVNPKLPNFGCPILSVLKGEEIMIRNMMQSVHNYKIRCPTVSGSQVNLTWEPNATQEILQTYAYNSSLPFHVLSPNGTEISHAMEAGQSADIPIEFNLTKGYKMFYVSLSLSGVPQDTRIFINPNVSDYFSNQLDKDSVANGTLHVYVDSATTPGNYDVAIVGEGSVNNPSGKEVDIKNSVGIFHLDVLPSTNKVWLEVGAPTAHQVIILTKLGTSTMASGFGGETDVPITVYSSQKTPVTLGVEQYPQDAFYKFIPDTVVATSQGANVTMIMAGAGVPNPYYPNALHTDVAKILATSRYENSTAVGFLPVYKGEKITILHGPESINLTSGSFGGNSFFGFKIIGVIYDPVVGNSSTMSVHLSVLGTMNGTKLLPIPSWLNVAFPIPDFTLGADKPYYFVLNFTTQHGFEEPYPIAINENVGGSNFTQVVWLPKENHIRFGGMPRQMSPLEQIKSGIKSKDITCLAGLQLITKAEDGTSVCVKPDTAQILIQRGWARQESNNHGIQAQSKITLNESNVSPLSKEPFINQRWGDEIKVNNETEASQIAGYLVKFPTKLPENYKLQLSVVDPITPANKYVYLFYSKSPISDTMRWHDFLNAGGITINIHHNQYQNPSPDPWATLIIGLQHMGYKDAHEVTINGYKAWVGSNHTRFFNGWHVEDPSELEYLANGTDVQIAGDFTTNELIDMGQSMYP